MIVVMSNAGSSPLASPYRQRLTLHSLRRRSVICHRRPPRTAGVLQAALRMGLPTPLRDHDPLYRLRIGRSRSAVSGMARCDDMAVKSRKHVHAIRPPRSFAVRCAEDQRLDHRALPMVPIRHGMCLINHRLHLTSHSSQTVPRLTFDFRLAPSSGIGFQAGYSKACPISHS